MTSTPMKPKNENQQISRGYHFAMRIATELVAATLIGCAMGYGLDKWLGTWPWLFLVFFLFGVIAGFLNVYRAVTPGYTRTFDPNGNP